MFGKKKQQMTPEAKPSRAFARNDVMSVDYAQSQPSPVLVRNFSQTVPLLSIEEMERTYLSSGLIWKGINKKARDSLRKGFRLKPDDEDREDEQQLNADAREWMRQVGYLPKAIQALREMFVFGDGFLEMGFSEKGDPMSPPAKSAAPVAVYNVDPMSLLPVRDPRTQEVMAYLCHKPGIAYPGLPAGSVPQATFDPVQPAPVIPNVLPVRSLDRTMVRRWALGQGELPAYVQAIHPDRIQHFKVNAIRQHFDALGISVIQAAYVNSLAKLAGDLAAGDILEWYAKGFFTLQIENGTPEEINDASRALEAAKRARKNHFVGSERSKFDIKSPLAFNVKPFYDNFNVELAGALEMPVMVLLGVQTGTVTGSSTDLTQYYDDVHGFQTLHLEAPILGMLRRVLKRDDFSIEFSPLYVDKQTEADIAFKRSQATSQLYGGRVLSRREAIRFMRTGELPNPDLVPEAYAAESGPVRTGDGAAGDGPDAGDKPADGSAQPKDSGDEPDDEGDDAALAATIEPLTAQDRAEIERLRALGKQLMDEGVAG